MADYFDAFTNTFLDYASYLWREVRKPHLGNYFYWLLGLSLGAYVLELLFPWRRAQPRIRQDFWLDAFYVLFNYFLFGLIGFAALSEVGVLALRDAVAAALGLFFDAERARAIQNTVLLDVRTWPAWTQVATLFVVKDFVHWNVHRLLHRVPWLWERHKVHHSVVQMGFAAHLRFHWLENVVYKSLQYVPLALVGFGIDDFLWAHLVATAIGHLNHANLVLPLGPLRYVLNNPQMHIWHHAWDLPADRRYGMNYGISLSCWDYLFGTACIPHDGRDIRLGFPGLERFPKTFLGQLSLRRPVPTGT